jgi:hypothetical protein
MYGEESMSEESISKTSEEQIVELAYHVGISKDDLFWITVFCIGIIIIIVLCFLIGYPKVMI